MKLNHLFFASLSTLMFINCESDSESDLRTVPEKVKYSSSIKPIIVVKCNSCHNSNSTSPYVSYIQTKNAIDNILNRIQRNDGDNLLMPQNGPKLSQADINLFLKWKTDGFLE